MTISFPSLCTFSYTLLAFSRLHASRNLLVHARQHFPLFFFLITVTSSFPHRGQRFIFARNQNSWIAICAVKTLVFVICITFSPCRKTKIVLIVSIFNFFFHLSPSILMRIKKKKSYEKSNCRAPSLFLILDHEGGISYSHDHDENSTLDFTSILRSWSLRVFHSFSAIILKLVSPLLGRPQCCVGGSNHQHVKSTLISFNLSFVGFLFIFLPFPTTLLSKRGREHYDDKLRGGLDLRRVEFGIGEDAWVGSRSIAWGTGEGRGHERLLRVADAERK